jgi:hypothetical protein
MYTVNALMDACSEHFHERILTISFMIQVWMALVCTLTRFELCYFSLGLIKGTGHRNNPNTVHELKQETFAFFIIIYKLSWSVDGFHRWLQIFLYYDVTRDERLHMSLHCPQIMFYNTKDQLVHFSECTQYQEVVIRIHTACFSIA